MQDALYDEAQALLAPGSVCEDPPDWAGLEHRPWHREIEHGLLRPDGMRAGLILVIEHMSSPKTQITRYQFGIYRGILGGRQRVYQLTISKSRRPIKNRHALSHEHYGDQRLSCPSDCSAWSFEQALAYFAERTHLTFQPPIEDPTSFRLKP